MCDCVLRTPYGIIELKIIIIHPRRANLNFTAISWDRFENKTVVLNVTYIRQSELSIVEY